MALHPVAHADGPDGPRAGRRGGRGRKRHEHLGLVAAAKHGQQDSAGGHGREGLVDHAGYRAAGPGRYSAEISEQLGLDPQAPALSDGDHMLEVQDGCTGDHPAQGRGLGGTAAAHGLVRRVEQTVRDRLDQRQRTGRKHVPAAGAVGPDRYGGDLQRVQLSLGGHDPRDGRASRGHGTANHHDRQRRDPQPPGHRGQPGERQRPRADLTQGQHASHNRHGRGTEQGLPDWAARRRRHQQPTGTEQCPVGETDHVVATAGQADQKFREHRGGQQSGGLPAPQTSPEQDGGGGHGENRQREP